MRELIRAIRIDLGKHVYVLRMFDTGTSDRRGQTRIDFEFERDGKELFSGSDFCCSPMCADDSDESAACLLSFLTLRPGDTDREYFEKYTPEQLEWAQSSECESLQCDVSCAEEDKDFSLFEDVTL